MVPQDAELLERVDAAVKAVDDEVNRLRSAVNSVGDLLPATVRTEWDQACGLWEDLRQIIERVRLAPGRAESLRAYATMWDRDVGGATSAIAGRADPTYTKVQDYWEGEGVQAYLAVLPAQRRALEEIKETFTDPISTTHEQMARAIDSFWTSLEVACWAVYFALAGATIFAIYGGPVLVSAAVGGFLGVLYWQAGNVTTAYESLRSEAANQRSLLHQKLNDNGPYPDGGWPRAAVGV